MQNNPRELPDNRVATQRNDLLHGQQTLSLVQKRIFALAIKQISRNDRDLEMYTVQISDLVEASNSKNVFNTIEQETENLMRKILLKKEYKEGSKKPITTRWSMVSKAVHNPGEGTLSIRINNEIREMLLELKEQGGFTPVPIAELMACRSTHGQRLYEMLYSWRRSGRWEVSVDDLRFSLNLEGKYKSFTMFRKRVLKKAQKDLQENTNMRFKWKEESRGKGKAITHLIFEFELVIDQLSMDLEPSQSKFDIWNLRSRLRNDAKLPSSKIERVMKFLENNPNERERFKQEYGAVSNRLQEGKDENNMTIKSPQKYAWTRIEPLLEK